MRERRNPTPKRTKVFAALLGIFILCNLILVTPVFANVSAQQVVANPSVCIPILFPCPTPTSTPTPRPTTGPTATPTGSPTVTPTGSPTATPTPPPVHLLSSNFYTMQATQIIAINAHLDQSDPLFPVLIFGSATIQGLKITHLSFSLGARGTVTSSNVRIKTSALDQLMTALGSFANKADLLVLLAGGTVPKLVMNNASLQVDRFIDLGTITLPGLHIP